MNMNERRLSPTRVENVVPATSTAGIGGGITSGYELRSTSITSSVNPSLSSNINVETVNSHYGTPIDNPASLSSSYGRENVVNVSRNVTTTIGTTAGNSNI